VKRGTGQGRPEPKKPDGGRYRRDVPYQSLLKVFLAERLETEAKAKAESI
jgi:hypothetical protein